MLKDYLQVKSLTWWTGVSAIGIGAAKASGMNAAILGHAGDVISIVAGMGAGTPPAQLIVLGLGLVGIRAKLQRLGV